MLTIFARVFKTATGGAALQKHHETHQEWSERFVPHHRRKQQMSMDPYRFNPHRDLW